MASPHPDPAVRRARQEAHRSFDRLWREGHMTRSGAYRWLAARLGVPEPEAHMGKMEDLTTLRRVVRLCDRHLGPIRVADDFPDDLEDTWATTTR